MNLTTKGTKVLSLGILSLAVTLAAQTPPAQQPPPQNPTGAQQPQPGRGGGGRGGVQVMTLTTTAWADGGVIPAKHAQNGGELSPPLAWSNVPEGVGSFVLIVHDLDASPRSGRGGPAVTDFGHWVIWNIPGAVRALPEGVPHDSELPDGSRQIGPTGPGYRGPAAPADGPPHHYVFELYALDGPLEVAAVGASPDETRAAVLTAMAGKVRGKATLIGMFKRN